MGVKSDAMMLEKVARRVIEKNFLEGCSVVIKDESSLETEVRLGEGVGTLETFWRYKGLGFQLVTGKNGEVISINAFLPLHRVLRKSSSERKAVANLKSQGEFMIGVLNSDEEVIKSFNGNLVVCPDMRAYFYEDYWPENHEGEYCFNRVDNQLKFKSGISLAIRKGDLVMRINRDGGSFITLVINTQRLMPIDRGSYVRECATAEDDNFCWWLLDGIGQVARCTVGEIDWEKQV